MCARTARSPWEVQPRTTAIWLQCGPACVSRMQRPGKNSSRSWSIFSSTKATTALPSGGQDVANESMGDVAATTAAAPYACKALKRDVALPHSSRCCGGLRCLVTSRRRYERRMNYCPFIGLRGSAPHGPPIAPQVPGWSWLDPLGPLFTHQVTTSYLERNKDQILVQNGSNWAESQLAHPCWVYY